MATRITSVEARAMLERSLKSEIAQRKLGDL